MILKGQVSTTIEEARLVETHYKLKYNAAIIDYERTKRIKDNLLDIKNLLPDFEKFLIKRNKKGSSEPERMVSFGMIVANRGRS